MKKRDFIKRDFILGYTWEVEWRNIYRNVSTKFWNFWKLFLFNLLLLSYVEAQIPTIAGSGIGTVAKVSGNCPADHAQSVDDPALCYKLAPVSSSDRDQDGFLSNLDCDDTDPTVFNQQYYSCSSNTGTRLCNNGTWGSCVLNSTTPLCEATGSGVCYYINASTGLNSNAGTYAAPFQTIGKIAGGGGGSVPASPITLTAGSVVYLLGTTNFTSTYANAGSTQVVAELNSDGTSANPIIIKRYPGATAEIAVTGGAAGFKVFGDHTRLVDLAITTGVGSGDRVPVFSQANTNFQVLRSYIHDSGGNGDNNFGCIYANGTNNSTFYKNFLHNCSRASGSVENISAIKWLDGMNTGVGENHYSDRHSIWWDTVDAVNNGACQRNKHGVTAANTGVNGHRMLNGFCINSRTPFHTSTAKVRFEGWIVHSASEQIYINACDTGSCPDMQDMKIRNNTFVNSGALTWRLPKYVAGENVDFSNNIIVDNKTYAGDSGVINIDVYGGDSQKTFLEANNMLSVNNNCYHNTASALFFGYYLGTSPCNTGAGTCAAGGRYSFANWLTNSAQDANSFSENANLDADFLPTSLNCLNKGFSFGGSGGGGGGGGTTSTGGAISMGGQPWLSY